MSETRIITGPGPYCMTDGEASRIKRRHEELMLAQREAQARRDAEPPPALRVMQRDTLVFLWERGHVTPEQRDAGREIASVHQYVTAEVAGRITATYWERMAGGQRDDIPMRLRAPYLRYARWSEQAGTLTARGARTVRDVVLAIAADNLGHEQLAPAWAMCPRTILRHLSRGLDLYLQTRLAEPA